MVDQNSPGADAVEAHLANLPEPQQSTLRLLRSRLREVLPDADEGIKYNMPSFIVGGSLVASYEGFKQHCSYFPCSGGILATTGPLKGGTPAGKGTLRFPVDAPLPLATVRKLVKARLAEIASGKR